MFDVAEDAIATCVKQAAKLHTAGVIFKVFLENLEQLWLRKPGPLIGVIGD